MRRSFGGDDSAKGGLTHFWFKTLRGSKVIVAKDHGEKFRSRLASSFSGIVNCILYTAN